MQQGLQQAFQQQQQQCKPHCCLCSCCYSLSGADDLCWWVFLALLTGRLHGCLHAVMPLLCCSACLYYYVLDTRASVGLSNNAGTHARSVRV
jgi:hypothetical protein